MDISTRNLRAFLTLVEHRNFTRAAKSFCLSQPAFSALVRSTEATIGIELIDRASPQFQLTRAGELFIELASSTLDHFDGRVRALQTHSLAVERVVVTAMVTLTYGVLPPILAAFQSDLRQVQLDLHVAHPNECIEMVEARQVDFAVTAVDAVASRLNVERLFREPFELVCGSEHPPASLHRVSVHHLTAYPFVHYKRGTMTRRLIDAAVHPAQIQVANEVEHVHTIRALVESGGGIGVIPAGMRSHFAGSRVVVKPIEGCALWRDIALVSHPARPLPPAAMCLASLIRRELGISTNHAETSNLENESRSSES